MKGWSMMMESMDAWETKTWREKLQWSSNVQTLMLKLLLQNRSPNLQHNNTIATNIYSNEKERAPYKGKCGGGRLLTREMWDKSLKRQVRGKSPPLRYMCKKRNLYKILFDLFPFFHKNESFKLGFIYLFKRVILF